MKYITLFLISFSTFALDVKFYNGCEKTPFLNAQVDVENFKTVGDLTHYILKENNISYVGSTSGINSILDTPSGIDAMEVLSDKDMKAHGWCYKLDGVLSSKLIDEQELSSDMKNLTWYYGYYLYKDGAWTGTCEFQFFNSFICD